MKTVAKELLKVAKLLTSGKVRVRTQTPDVELDDVELIQRVKSYGKDAQSSYGLFVRARGLRPKINMKKFREIWDSVSPNKHEKVETVDFKPTHKSKDVEGLTIMVTQVEPNIVRFISSYGGTGSSPAGLFKSQYKKI